MLIVIGPRGECVMKKCILQSAVVLASAAICTISADAGNLTRSEKTASPEVNRTTTQRQTAAPVLRAPVQIPTRSILDAGESQQGARKTRTQINWSSSLSDARQRAQEQGKMIFWVHMLGKLDGAT